MVKAVVVSKSAEEINEAYRKLQEYQFPVMERVIDLGRRLAEEKAKHKHGEWIPWIEANLEFGHRQAKKYMRAYEKRDDLQKLLSNGNSKCPFAIDGAMKLLAKPRALKPQIASTDPEMEQEAAADDAPVDRELAAVKKQILRLLESYPDESAYIVGKLRSILDIATGEGEQ